MVGYVDNNYNSDRYENVIIISGNEHETRWQHVLTITIGAQPRWKQGSEFR